MRRAAGGFGNGILQVCPQIDKAAQIWLNHAVAA
jgi:hypothetical protein